MQLCNNNTPVDWVFLWLSLWNIYGWAIVIYLMELLRPLSSFSPIAMFLLTPGDLEKFCVLHLLFTLSSPKYWFKFLCFSFLSICTVEALTYWMWSSSSSSIPQYDMYWFTVSVIWWLWWEVNIWWSLVVGSRRYYICLSIISVVIYSFSWC